MEVIAKGKFIRLSPKKARSIAKLVRGSNAKVTLETLKLMPQKSASEIAKVLASAMANAENNFSLEKNDLTIASIMIDGGPALKRHRPRSKGMVSPLKKRTSHITVIVSGDVKTKKVEAPKAEAKKEVKADEHRIEVERPESKRNDNIKGNVNVAKNTMFRRKTG